MPEEDVQDRLQLVQSELGHLRTALESRERIGIAKGMLMARYGLNEDQAFAFLSRTSQDRNVKLRDVAGQVIEELRRTDVSLGGS